MFKDLELKDGHLVLLALAVLIGVTAGHFLFPSGSITGSSVSSPNGSAEEVVSLMNKASPVNATLKNVEEFHGLYRIIVKARGREMPLYMTEDGEYLLSGSTKVSSLRQRLNSNQSQTSNTENQQQKQTNMTIGNFKTTNKEICKKDGKPSIYFFGSSSCPHCSWEHPIVENVTSKFEGHIDFHNNMDNQKDRDVFSEYSTGGIPTIVLGCKYYRVGSGESLGKAKEKEVLTALICDLTGGKPTETCSKVSDMMEQI